MILIVKSIEDDMCDRYVVVDFLGQELSLSGYAGDLETVLGLDDVPDTGEVPTLEEIEAAVGHDAFKMIKAAMEITKDIDSYPSGDSSEQDDSFERLIEVEGYAVIKRKGWGARLNDGEMADAWVVHPKPPPKEGADLQHARLCASVDVAEGVPFGTIKSSDLKYSSDLPLSVEELVKPIFVSDEKWPLWRDTYLATAEECGWPI